MTKGLIFLKIFKPKIKIKKNKILKLIFTNSNIYCQNLKKKMFLCRMKCMLLYLDYLN